MTFFFVKRGSPARPTALFLHGAGVSSWMWTATMEALGEVHALAPDLPGLGRNAHLGAFTVREAANRLAAFVREHAHEGRAHLVGHSLGGAVAARLAADAPDLVRSVTLIGVTARPIAFEGALVNAALAATNLTRLPGMLRLQARALGVPQDDLAAFEADQRAMTRERLRGLMDEGLRFRVPARWDELNVPLLALVGAREQRPNLLSATDLVRGVPGARAYAVPNGSHAWMAGRHDLLASILRAFWEGRSLPSELAPLPAH